MALVQEGLAPPDPGRVGGPWFRKGWRLQIQEGLLAPGSGGSSPGSGLSVHCVQEGLSDRLSTVVRRDGLSPCPLCPGGIG